MTEITPMPAGTTMANQMTFNGVGGGWTLQDGLARYNLVRRQCY